MKTNCKDGDARHLVTRRGGTNSDGLTPAAAIVSMAASVRTRLLVSALLPVKQTGPWSELCDHGAAFRIVTYIGP
jgi:hypothetical protein